mmetsp:Transcript_11789/g.35957  ORF Transcript_11789/g.35957 Transcript_11789/m.35957 type:complete len:520 (+) Transcript_11789:403-1962(+)|eukprot:CAMPEP_0198736040 /NCGR_PEP_ID=MMETSP1475-20131203/63177_1 /TAXON_ID= ORGANISM="Unidentified sp., Strain CCMP1999" /NCGR_SAMPLE_ID=MMETSP1475 /ASSEMBLY_ACC=CAM_ASM_001111 /LENGTH=519 /DNA_ID=CAMNT_0044499787 /DNA_START=375 /DNA_END=1934 /DNA_ORIENTATION=+
MSSFPIEICRTQFDEFERSVRLATAALREHEHVARRSKKGAGEVERKDPYKDLFVTAEGEPMINSGREADLVARVLIDRAAERVANISKFLNEDENGAIRKDLAEIEGDGNPDTPLQLFYDRLKVVQSLNDGLQGQEPAPTCGQLDRLAASTIRPNADFTGEEAGGKYLDLHEIHHKFLNLKGINPELYDYVTFLQNFYAFGSIPAEVRSKPQYKTYLEDLLKYLVGFVDRAMPLKFVQEELGDIRNKTLAQIKKSSSSVVDVEKYDSAKALCDKESPDALKEALKKLGLKCGGTPAQRAERLFAAAKTSATENGSLAEVEGKASLQRDIQLLEAQVKFVMEDVLGDHIDNTRMNVEKKLALSYEELKAERLNEENPQNGIDEDENEDSGEEKPIYNPKDVPLGWDGKPIPYWLYKLHGLNHEYKCEVCGDVTYRGPRNFERHFSEARHTHNLKMLGIQYSRYFYMVTKIDDVQRLAEKQQQQSVRKQFQNADEEEFEDAEGNVFNRKTYEDLRRQGLL